MFYCIFARCQINNFFTVSTFKSHTLSWTIYIGSFVFVSLIFALTYSFKKSAYWQKKYDEKLEASVLSNDEIQAMQLLLSNYQSENNFLMGDYFMIDSLLLTERFKNNELIGKITQYQFLLGDLSQKNIMLQNQLLVYQRKVDNLLGELHVTQSELMEAKNMYENLLLTVKMQTIPDVAASPILDLNFLHQNKLISFHASGFALTKKGRATTKKVKHTKGIQLCLRTFDRAVFDLGKKTLFVRIADPNGNILPFVKDELDLFDYQGEQILFSEKHEVVFTSSSFPLCLDYQPVTPLISGVYWVYVFCDGIKIGEASFDLY